MLFSFIATITNNRMSMQGWRILKGFMNACSRWARWIGAQVCIKWARVFLTGKPSSGHENLVH